MEFCELRGESVPIILGISTTVIVLIVMCIIIYQYANYYTSRTHFVCPCCGTAFKLSKVDFIVAFKTGVSGQRIVVCPKCGYQGRMSIMDDD